MIADWADYQSAVRLNQWYETELAARDRKIRLLTDALIERDTLLSSRYEMPEG